MKFNSRVRLKICIFFNLKIKAHNLYNPYTCYQVQAGTATWTSAFSSCSGKGVNMGFTTMIMRTNAEYTSAEYFRDFVFQGSFWVCLIRILKLKFKI